MIAPLAWREVWALASSARVTDCGFGQLVLGGAILLWHVDDIEAAFARLKELGAKEYDPITERGETGFVTASVVDPFGNVLGVMHNPHWVEGHAARSA